MAGLKACVGNDQRSGVGNANVFAGQNNHATGNEQGVFAAFNHAGKPIHGSVGVAASHGFYERRDDVIMLLAFFIVKRNILLSNRLYQFVSDYDFIFLFVGENDKFEEIQ